MATSGPQPSKATPFSRKRVIDTEDGPRIVDSEYDLETSPSLHDSLEIRSAGRLPSTVSSDSPTTESSLRKLRRSVVALCAGLVLTSIISLVAIARSTGDEAPPDGSDSAAAATVSTDDGGRLAPEVMEQLVEMTTQLRTLEAEVAKQATTSVVESDTSESMIDVKRRISWLEDANQRAKSSAGSYSELDTRLRLLSTEIAKLRSLFDK